jgi:hypothetical protein
MVEVRSGLFKAGRDAAADREAEADRLEAGAERCDAVGPNGPKWHEN